MNGSDLAREVVNVTWDVLQTLTSSLKAWRMNELAGGALAPPFDLGADWSAAVAHVRAELDSGALDEAERIARIAYLADLLVDRVRAVLDWQVALDANGGRHAWCTRARGPAGPAAGVRVAFDDLIAAPTSATPSGD